MAWKSEREMSLTRGLEEYDLTIEFEVGSWGCAAQLSGPPENCYPGEAPEIWITAAYINAPAWARTAEPSLSEVCALPLGTRATTLYPRYPFNQIPFALTDDERWALEEELYQTVEPPEPDPDDYFDDWRDER